MIYKPPKRAADGMSKSSNSFPTADESDSGTVVGELRSPITYNDQWNYKAVRLSEEC